MIVKISVSKSEIAEMVKERLELSLPDNCRMDVVEETDSGNELMGLKFVFDSEQK